MKGVELKLVCTLSLFVAYLRGFSVAQVMQYRIVIKRKRSNVEGIGRGIFRGTSQIFVWRD